jgi:exosome complex exonuclease RRP6
MIEDPVPMADPTPAPGSGDKERNDEFIRQFMAAVAGLSKSSNLVPAGNDYSYYKSFKEFSSLNKSLSSSTSTLIHEILQFVATGENRSRSNVALSDDLTDSALYDQVVDAIDILLDQADQHLENIDKNILEGYNDESRKRTIGKNMKTSLMMDKQRILTSNVANIPKPQERFYADIDNSRDRPFKPKLKEKFWGTQAPLDLTPKPISGSGVSNNPRNSVSSSGAGLNSSEDGTVIGPSTYYPHPYEKELLKFNIEIMSGGAYLRCPNGVEVPSPSAPFEFVDKPESLLRIIDELAASKEIAVDLEHHSYRSFLGLTCLMQVRCR